MSVTMPRKKVDEKFFRCLENGTCEKLVTFIAKAGAKGMTKPEARKRDGFEFENCFSDLVKPLAYNGIITLLPKRDSADRYAVANLADSLAKLFIGIANKSLKPKPDDYVFSTKYDT